MRSPYRATLLKRFWVPVWFAPRAYWSFAILALAFATAAVVPPVWWIALTAAFVFAAALGADAFAGAQLGEIDVERFSPDTFSLRRTAVLAYRIRNTTSRMALVTITESPSNLLRFDGDDPAAWIPPQAEASVERAVTPVARGSGELETLYATVRTTLGMLCRRLRLPQRTPVRVYPDLSAVERYGSLHARNRLIEAGLRRMRLRGAGTEAESVRDWSGGDPFRSINWKATARRGKMMVSQYEVERSQNVMIVLDAGRLMTPRVDRQRKFDYAVTAALSVASVASLANDKVGVVAFAGEILRAFAPRPSGRSPARIAQEIHDLAPRFEESDYDRAFAYVRTHVHKRSLIVVFTDMVDPVAQSSVLAQIGTLCRRHLVVCAFMNDAAIDTALSRQAATAPEAYAAGVALELREERRVAAATLARLGVRVIDVPAHDLTTALIDQYLQIKQRGLL